jgi:hypothetical protein
MGGYGSGGFRYGRQRTLIERCFVLDANMLARKGLFLTQSALALNWGLALAAVAVFSPHLQAIRVILHGLEDPVDQVIRMSSTPCHLGGYRFFLVCPICGTRATKLYLPSKDTLQRPDIGPFACRGCHGLVYASRNIADEYRIAIRRVGRVEMKLGRRPSAFGELPPKPKRMRNKTYGRLTKEFEAERRRAGELLMIDCITRFRKRVMNLLRAEGAPSE